MSETLAYVTITREAFAELTCAASEAKGYLAHSSGYGPGISNRLKLAIDRAMEECELELVKR